MRGSHHSNTERPRSVKLKLNLVTSKEKTQKDHKNMGEDVAVDIAQSKNSAGIDETDKTSTIISTTLVNIEAQLEDNNTSCSAMQPPQQFNDRNAKVATAVGTVVEHRPSTSSTRKWFNIHFSSSRHQSSSSTTTDDKNSSNNRHSWHLNDSLEM